MLQIPSYTPSPVHSFIHFNKNCCACTVILVVCLVSDSLPAAEASCRSRIPVRHSRGMGIVGGGVLYGGPAQDSAETCCLLLKFEVCGLLAQDKATGVNREVGAMPHYEVAQMLRGTQSLMPCIT